ncbi:MAG: hypothetical protein PHU03_04100 [Syntrophales bacterium]|nr:hypothetical protein [Syntrophales bacterium]
MTSPKKPFSIVEDDNITSFEVSAKQIGDGLEATKRRMCIGEPVNMQPFMGGST